MNEKDEIIAKYKAKIKKLSEELAKEFLETEDNLEKRFTSFDSEVQKILIEIGNNTMQIVGTNLTEVEKKSLS